MKTEYQFYVLNEHLSLVLKTQQQNTFLKTQFTISLNTIKERVNTLKGLSCILVYKYIHLTLAVLSIPLYVISSV